MTNTNWNEKNPKNKNEKLKVKDEKIKIKNEIWNMTHEK
jgi:hypothetical protein